MTSAAKFLPWTLVVLSAHFCYLCFFAFFFFHKSNAQNATADPSEVRALNTIFQQWDAQAVPGLWNISGELCSGTAINRTGLEDTNNNPSIKCDCSYDNGNTCHITQIRVQDLNIRGEIPEELLALNYLTILKIDLNFFTGPLPAFIGKLSRLQVLTVGHNAFTGSIPKELGNLKELTFLAIGSNSFSGTLPHELGYLPKLEQLYMDSCGVGGEIPSTFANLRNMRIMWLSDSPFTGKIPDFIGSWTNLTSLRFQGNSFEGPIPSSVSNLTLLTSLRISDLYNVSSSLDFIKGLKSLTELILRNALISGSIPSDIGDYQSLTMLDLSFNNLSGQIPGELFKLINLTSLFLGNNSISGTLPSSKGESLQNIDLSYNELSGSFPPWVTPKLQLNLVANNFSFDSSNMSVLPRLHCLQRNFQCDMSTPRNANFAIKCGGPEISEGGIVYEEENSTAIGAASYYVVNTEKWALSNVGVFLDTKDPKYIESTFDQVVQLYQTSRMSPSSLRYYGLGLENGDYTVNLLFAETVHVDRTTKTWASLGRRVFNIYIQGRLQHKDFDISKQQNGNRVVPMEIIAPVTQNFLEIHLFWAGKGTCCIPHPGQYGPLISAISVSKIKSKSRTGLIVGVVLATGVIGLMLFTIVLYLKKKGSYVYEDEELVGIGPKPNTYSYAELRSATEDFNLSNKLGEGGFGPVYKGTLNDGKVVAVKQLSVASHQGNSQFMAEIATISAVQHRNLVKLYGCCIERNRRLLVYEYLENKSLDQALFGKNGLHLDWPTRFSVCLGIARGLAYLHEESRPRIVHRDVKASNILLDAELCPKISDFGLAKLYDDKKTHISTRVAGTIGYLAPEYAMLGRLTEKADVFGFGVVSLEILCGRPNSVDSLNTGKIYLLEWAWNLHESNRSLELVDPTLTAFDESDAMRMVGVALLCTQASPTMRPPMSRVVAMLAGDIEVSGVTTKPSYLTDWDFEDKTSSFLTEETPTSFSSKSSSNQQHSQVDYASDTNAGVYAMLPPISMTKPMLHEVIREGS